MTAADERYIRSELARLRQRLDAAKERYDQNPNPSSAGTMAKYRTLAGTMERALQEITVGERHREHVRRIGRTLEHQYRVGRLTQSAYIEMNRVISEDGGDTDG